MRKSTKLMRCCVLIVLGLFLLEILHVMTTFQHINCPRIAGPIRPSSIVDSVTKLDLRVIVLTYDRENSLKRLLDSLNQAEYYGDRVHIDTWLDRSKKGGHIDSKTYQTASSFSFRYGSLKVHNHTKHVGVRGQWIDTWKVDNGSREIAVILEDDLMVSKYFYKWLKLVHTKYDHLPYINGYSLQGRSMTHAENGGGNLRGPESQVLFAYPVLGSWGFSPNRKNWIKFVDWYHSASRDPKFQPLVPGLLPSLWYAEFIRLKRTDTMWTMWHIYHAHKNHELTVYVNFPGKQGLTINFEEPGLHYHNKTRKTRTKSLLRTWNSTYEDLPSAPVDLNAGGEVVTYPWLRKLVQFVYIYFYC